MARRSKNAAVLDFFRTAPIEAADVVYELAREVVLARRKQEGKGAGELAQKRAYNKKGKAAGATAPAPIRDEEFQEGR